MYLRKQPEARKAPSISNQTQTSKLFRLFDLTQELQDKIFAIANPYVEDLKIVFLEAWKRDELRQRQLQGLGYVTRPFPESPVEAWMVSKRWFTAATEAWFAARTFEQDVYNDLDLDKAVGEQFLDRRFGLFFEYARHAVIKYYVEEEDTIEQLGRCRSLKHLEINTLENIFYPLGGKDVYPWEQRYKGSRIVEALSKSGVGALRGLRSIKFAPVCSNCINTPAKKAESGGQFSDCAVMGKNCR